MSIYIYNEIWLFVRAFAVGAVLILCYSLLQEKEGSFSAVRQQEGFWTFFIGCAQDFWYLQEFTGSTRESCVVFCFYESDRNLQDYITNFFK